MVIKMRIREKTDKDSASEGMDQWLIGAIGALVTTLPSFLILPAWFLFTENYRITKDSSEEIDTTACFLINLCAGAVIWALVILLIN